MEPATTKPLRYSEVPIFFSRNDQWTSLSELGKFPLVLDPVVVGSQLTRVLINGGSGLNLFFMSTLKKMGQDISKMLFPSKAPF
jgi:ABC-type molybdate transport system permease subunit